jgi:hypothetical protein
MSEFVFAGLLIFLIISDLLLVRRIEMCKNYQKEIQQLKRRLIKSNEAKHNLS